MDMQEFWTHCSSKFDLESKVRLLDGSVVKYVDLDNAATTKPFRSVVGRINRELLEYGSVHRGAGEHSKITTHRYDTARQTIRTFVNASLENYVIFTLNTTSAINHLAELMGEISGSVLVSNIEHSSNLLPWKKYNHLIQFDTEQDGTFDLSEIEKKLKGGNVKLVAVTGSSNVTGYKPPIFDIAKLAHHYGSKIFVDVCQLIPHEKVDISPDDDLSHLDFIAFSGHKMYAPFGVGVLIGHRSFFDAHSIYQIGGGNLTYISRELGVSRQFQERDHDAGTPNAMGAFALEESVLEMQKIGLEHISLYEKQLTEGVIDSMRGMGNIRLYLKNQLGSVVPFDVIGMPPRPVAEVLAQEYGIGTRAGSFCTYELIRKLKGISEEDIQTLELEVSKGVNVNIPSLARASFSIRNSPEDASRFVNALVEISQKSFDFYKSRYHMNTLDGTWHLV